MSRKNRRTYMSMSDSWHSPVIDALAAGLSSRSRVDSSESASLEQNGSVNVDPLVRVIEGAAGGGSVGTNDFQDSRGTSVELSEHNSRIEAQEMARQPSSAKKENPVKKGIAFVAGPSETVGTNEALARLDQNGDGRLDQAEVKKAIRADESTSTFAALSQYQKPLEPQSKISEGEDLMSSKLFHGDEVKVEKLFDDEHLDQDLYENDYGQTGQSEQAEDQVPDLTS